MSPFIGSSRSLPLGVALSVLIHGAGVATIARYGDRLFHSESVPVQQDPARDAMIVPEPEPVRPLILGLEESPHKTDTWLGFADPTEHKAPLATVDQAEMNPAPGAGGDASEPKPMSAQPQPPQPEAPRPTPDNQVQEQPDAKPSPPQPESPAAPADEAPAPSTPARDVHVPDSPDPKRSRPEPVPDPNSSEKAPEPEALEAPAPSPLLQPTSSSSGTPEQRPSDAPRLPPEATLGPRPQTPSPEPQPELQLQPEPQAQPPAPRPAPTSSRDQIPAGKPVRGERPGEKSDRESSAASKIETVDVYSFGRPAASKGLEIKTVRPRWTETTKLVAVPRNPVIRVTFSRSGRVTSAEFTAGQNTGWKDVDEPLLDAIYRWTAKGEALKQLPPAKDAGLTVEFRIMLR